MNNRFVDMVEQGAKAAEALAPEAGLMADVDPIDLGGVAGRAAGAAMRHPIDVVSSGVRFGARLMQVAATSLSMAVGLDAPPVIEPDAKDKRYIDPAWRENPLYSWYLQRHLLWEEFVAELIETADLDGSDGVKLDFLGSLVVNSVQPSNFLWSNPTAVKRAFETGGRSVAKGVVNMIDDVRHNDGYPKQVDTTAFTVGENMAITPGKVVYRNDLIELIQYEPQTKKVHSIPIVCSPPWINKYYVMDMAPDRSLIEWAVQHGHTVFAISYRNPDASMAEVTLEDYLVNGPRTAVDVVKEITDSEKVNLLAVCLGGSLAMMLASYLAAVDDDSLGTLTLLNTLVDFSEPGPLGAFTDLTTIERLEAKLQKEGVLPADNMRRTFDLLRPNDLVFNYVASNWLMGEDPPAFDLLSWNEDATNMPAAMHSFYLRACYLENRLARGELELCGETLDLSMVQADTFIVGAVNDHIVPWTSSYKTTQLLTKADPTYVLSSAGHVAGIINPPGPKAKSWTNANYPDDAQTWLDGADESDKSWWEIWADWAKTRGGKMIDPPPMGSTVHPVVGDAPGTYVHG